MSESCRVVTCPRVLQDLEVSLGPWGAVGAEVQGQDQGSHLRVPGVREQLKWGCFSGAGKPRAKGDNRAGLSPARA